MEHQVAGIARPAADDVVEFSRTVPDIANAEIAEPVSGGIANDEQDPVGGGQGNAAGAIDGPVSIARPSRNTRLADLRVSARSRGSPVGTAADDIDG